MDFEPKTERELCDELALPAGEYDFEVAQAERKASKKGNDMIELTLRVFSSDGTPRHVKDWLMPAMGFKLRHFCYASGLEDAYESGALDDYACQNASGRLKLVVEETEQWGKQNRVKDYIVPSLEENPGDPPNEDRPEPPKGVPAQQTKAAMQSAAPDDAIPF